MLNNARDKVKRELEDLLDVRAKFYDHMKVKTKEDLIMYYEVKGGEEKLTRRTSKHDILFALMDLIYPLDAVIARGEMITATEELETV